MLAARNGMGRLTHELLPIDALAATAVAPGRWRGRGVTVSDVPLEQKQARAGLSEWVRRNPPGEVTALDHELWSGVVGWMRRQHSKSIKLRRWIQQPSKHTALAPAG